MVKAPEVIKGAIDLLPSMPVGFGPPIKSSVLYLGTDNRHEQGQLPVRTNDPTGYEKQAYSSVRKLIPNRPCAVGLKQLDSSSL